MHSVKVPIVNHILVTHRSGLASQVRHVGRSRGSLGHNETLHEMSIQARISTRTMRRVIDSRF